MSARIQWDVVWSLLRTLLVAGGPVATLLIALGFPPVQVSTWTAIGLAGIGVLSIAVPGIKAALNRTDTSKVLAVKRLPPEAAVAAVEHLPADAKNQIKLAATQPEALIVATSALPGVVVGVDTSPSSPASPAMQEAANNPAQKNVMPIREGALP